MENSPVKENKIKIQDEFLSLLSSESHIKTKYKNKISSPKKAKLQKRKRFS